MAKSTDVSYASQARTIISDWPVIFALIKKYTRVELRKNVQMPVMLTMEQMDEVFTDKEQGFIRASIAARADVVAGRKKVTELQRAIIQQQQIIDIALNDLKARTKGTTEQQAVLQTTSELFVQHASQLNELRKQLPILQQQLNATEPELDKLAQQHDAEWEQARDKWHQQLLEKLTSIGLKLTDLQQQELLRHNTLAEVVYRFDTLEVKPPAPIE